MTNVILKKHSVTKKYLAIRIWLNVSFGFSVRKKNTLISSLYQILKLINILQMCSLFKFRIYIFLI